MVFQGLDGDAATARVAARSSTGLAERRGDFTLVQPPLFVRSARAALLGCRLPQGRTRRDFVLTDDRPGAPAGNVFWRTNLGEAGWFLQGYQSIWLPARADRADDQRAAWSMPCSPARGAGADAAFQQGPGRCAGRGGRGGARHRDQSGGDRGLRARHQRRRGAAGLRRRRRPRARSGARPPQCRERRRGDGRAAQAGAATRLLRLGIELLRGRLAERLLGRRTIRGCAQVKDKVDPEGLFFVHHGVGSEDWSPDGFTRLK